jgi:16S rRNA (cytosine967-C5)-methyltransferase
MAGSRRSSLAKRAPGAPSGRSASHKSRSSNRNRARRGDARVAHAPDAIRPALLVRGTNALRRILEFDAPADLVLRRFFRENPDLGRRDRGFVAETVFACLRRLRWYGHLVGERDARRLFILAADRLPAPERRELRPALNEDEWAWLAHCADRTDDALPLAIRAELPDWVV